MEPLLHHHARPPRRPFQARADAGPVRVAAGREAAVRVAVHNLAAERRTFTFRAEASRGWSLCAPFQAVALPADAAADVFFRLRPPGDARPGARATHRLWVGSGGARPLPLTVEALVVEGAAPR